MRDASTCRNACRAASVELLGSAPNVEGMERRQRDSLRTKTRRLLEELEGSFLACALNRSPVLTETQAAGASHHG